MACFAFDIGFYLAMEKSLVPSTFPCKGLHLVGFFLQQHFQNKVFFAKVACFDFNMPNLGCQQFCRLILRLNLLSPNSTI